MCGVITITTDRCSCGLHRFIATFVEWLPGTLAGTRRSLPCGECAFRCGARASPLRTPRPHTRVRACAHTRTTTRPRMDVRAGIDACRGHAAEHGSRSPHAHRTMCGPWAIVIAIDAARHRRPRLLPLIPPVSRRGRGHVNVDHRSFGRSACVRRGRGGRMQRWETSAE